MLLYLHFCSFALLSLWRVAFRDDRLGRDGAESVKQHAFFRTDKWDWYGIRLCHAPFIPEISSDEDTEYFDEIDPDKGQTESFPPATVRPHSLLHSPHASSPNHSRPHFSPHSLPTPPLPSQTFSGNQLPFVGFTYTKGQQLLRFEGEGQPNGVSVHCVTVAVVLLLLFCHWCRCRCLLRSWQSWHRSRLVWRRSWRRKWQHVTNWKSSTRECEV